MKVMYDYQAFLMQNYGGVSRYFANIMKGIQEISAFEYSLSVIGGRNYYLSERDKLKAPFWLRNKYFRSPHKAIKANQLNTLKNIEKGKIDVFHPTYFDGYFLDKLKSPLVITVHDMTYEKFPVFFNPDDPTSYNKRRLIEKADKIIAISQQTKNDILYYNNVDENKIEVIYHGIDLDSPLNYGEIEGVSEEFILYVGSRFGYKNFTLFIEAFAVFSMAHPNIQLVLVGSDLGIAECEMLHRFKLTEKVIVITAADNELNFLYQKALFFVYPSLYEGFGLPILEAFRHRCPVLLSAASCFPEVAGSAANYFEANSIESLVYQMKSLVDSKELREDLILKGTQKVKEYNMKSCIDQTLNLYNKLV